MNPHITLLTLGVDDLERALAFYRDGLGFSILPGPGRSPVGSCVQSWLRVAGLNRRKDDQRLDVVLDHARESGHQVLGILDVVDVKRGARLPRPGAALLKVGRRVAADRIGEDPDPG